MKRITQFAFSLVLLLALTGCYVEAEPVRSATVTFWQGGRPIKSWQLNGKQVQGLSVWLQQHRWGWHPVAATYAPSTMIAIQHTNGAATGVNVMSKVIVLGQHQRSLSEEESTSLRALLQEANGG